MNATNFVALTGANPGIETRIIDLQRGLPWNMSVVDDTYQPEIPEFPCQGFKRATK